jgi:hypothetical protein
MQEQGRSPAERPEPKGQAESGAERDERETAGDKDRVAARRKATEGSRGKRRRGGGSGSGTEEPA